MDITAAVLRSSQEPFTLETVSLDADLKEAEVLIRVVGVGMCRTDYAVRGLGGAIRLPAVLGHEGAGVVTAVGPLVRSLSVGDHVILSFDSCGRCRSCLLGRPAYCASFAALNLFGGRAEDSKAVIKSDGTPLAPRWFGQSSFAEHAIASERNAVRVASSLPLEILGPLGCGLQTGAGSIMHSFAVPPGARLAIFGLGAVGLAAVMAAKLSGVSTIIGVDQHQNRMDIALELGATHVLDSAAGNLGERIVTIDGGMDFALDTTGSGAIINEALRVLREEGTLGVVSRHKHDLVLAPGTLDRGRRIMHIFEGSANPHVFIPELVSLWQQGRFPFEKFLETYPLSAINDAESDSAEGRVVKPVLLPGR